MRAAEAAKGPRPRRRIGLAIALSLAWGLAGGIWAHFQSADYGPRWESYKRTCAHRSAEAPKLTPWEYGRCTYLKADLEEEFLRERTLLAGVIAIPIAAVWLMLWLLPSLRR